MYIAREVAAGFTVVLNPSHTLILGSDSAFTRPKPVLWISKEAQRTSKLSPGRGVRVDPPRGPHKGINKHAVDKIAGLGDIELVSFSHRSVVLSFRILGLLALMVVARLQNSSQHFSARPRNIYAQQLSRNSQWISTFIQWAG